MLVFSKTSLQRHRIAPRTPRAIYFSDDVYVGCCQDGDVLEISAVDPQLGTVFYTLDQTAAERPIVQRQTDNCLICHGSSQTKEIPGHVVRSVFANASGLPILSAGTYRIDHTSPLEKRWGGWYVTGTHGEQKHLGNLIVRGRAEPETIDNTAGHNLTSVADRFDTSRYLSPHSDIVALMVLEHQADAHNYLTRANFLTRQAMHYQQSLNRELGEPADHVWDSTKSRIKSANEPLVEYLLFSGEAELTGRIRGTSAFAEEFASAGRATARVARCEISIWSGASSSTRAAIWSIRPASPLCRPNRVIMCCGGCGKCSAARITARSLPISPARIARPFSRSCARPCLTCPTYWMPNRS